MALAPGIYAEGAVPTVEADAAAAVPVSKTYQLGTGVGANTSGATRTITIKKIAADGSTVVQQFTQDIPSDASAVPVPMPGPLLASQKLRWVASGSGVYLTIPEVTN